MSQVYTLPLAYFAHLRNWLPFMCWQNNEPLLHHYPVTLTPHHFNVLSPVHIFNNPHNKLVTSLFHTLPLTAPSIPLLHSSLQSSLLPESLLTQLQFIPLHPICYSFKIGIQAPWQTFPLSLNSRQLCLQCTTWPHNASVGIKAVLKPTNTMRQTLVHVKKTPREKKRSVVYQVPCKGCDIVHWWDKEETNLKTQLTEHRQAARWGDDRNGVAVHVQKCDHHTNWESALAERVVPGYRKRRPAEAIFIQQWSPTMNLDYGLQLPTVWNSIPDKLQSPLPP